MTAPVMTDEQKIARDKALRRVKKLLEMANGSSNDASTNESTQREAEKAMAMAFNIMQEHGIQMMEAMGERQYKTDCTHDEIPMGVNQYRSFKWCIILANAIQKLTGTMLVQDSKKRTFTFIGSQAEVNIARELYEWLMLQMRTMCRVAHYAAGIPTGGKGFVPFFSQYMEGIALKLWHRACNIAADACTALVVINTERNKEYAEATIGKMKKGKELRKSADTEAKLQGYKDGARVNLKKSEMIGEVNDFISA